MIRAEVTGIVFRSRSSQFCGDTNYSYVSHHSFFTWLCVIPGAGTKIMCDIVVLQLSCKTFVHLVGGRTLAPEKAILVWF